MAMPKYGVRELFADEPQMERDEDNLQREDDNLDFSRTGNDDDSDDLDHLYHALCDGNELAARGTMAFARCLQEMAAAAMHDNRKALEHWYRQGRHVLNNIGGDEMGGE